ncbi:MAG: TauD/TfdA family dioxygenase [Rhodospirillales bacterium]|nr:TauD/TfdA family dioxygenase [Rhodospirillales bacterium]
MAEVIPIKPHIGAEVRGVDLTKLSDDDFAVIYRAYLERNVVVIRDQKLDIGEYLDYSRRFGVVQPHISRTTRHPDHPEVTLLGANAVRKDGKVDDAVHKRGNDWHTDLPYAKSPAKATQLYAVEIPTHGGDTLFANMYAAYDALPDRLKSRIEGLTGHFRYGGARRYGHELLDEQHRRNPPEAFHPIARVHPETGRKALYVNPIHSFGIVGLDQEEGDELLQELFTYMIQPDADYRHNWRVGDVVIWDNRSSIHAAAGDHPPDQARIHWRVTIMEYGFQPDAVRPAA